MGDCRYKPGLRDCLTGFPTPLNRANLAAMKSFRAINLFRVLTVFIWVGGTITIVRSPALRFHWWSYASLCSGSLLAWLLADACADLKTLRLIAESSLTTDTKHEPGSFVPMDQLMQPSFQASGFVMPEINQVGDRVFKAHGEKVCTSCADYLETERTCRRDDASLSQITVTALGCQHWRTATVDTETQLGDTGPGNLE